MRSMRSRMATTGRRLAVAMCKVQKSLLEQWTKNIGYKRVIKKPDVHTSENQQIVVRPIMGSFLTEKGKMDEIKNVIAEANGQWLEDEKSTGHTGYMSRLFILATLPHSKPEGNEFTRHGKDYTLTIWAPKEIGLSYGVIPRLELAWVAKEATVKKEKKIYLGESLSAFLSQLEIVPTGGRWGSITRVKEQTRRLFASTISCVFENKSQSSIVGFQIANEEHFFWNPLSPTQGTLFNSYIVLSDIFFNEIIKHSVPYDMDILRYFRKSPLALDIYYWLTLRMFSLTRETHLLWSYLQDQFGADYADDKFGRYHFKQHFLLQLAKVLQKYDGAKIREDNHGKGLILMPGRPSILPR